MCILVLETSTGSLEVLQVSSVYLEISDANLEV